MTGKRNANVENGGGKPAAVGDTVDCADIRDFKLPAIAGDRRVVVFSSSVTDLRGVTHALDAARLDYRIVLMRMGEARTRKCFGLLREATGWPYLPQIFLDGGFVGGESELYKHPVIVQSLPLELRQSLNAQGADNRRGSASTVKVRQ